MMIETPFYFGSRMDINIHFAAFDLLSTPPASTPVERIFSTGGEATTGKRNRLTDHNLEREILLGQNKMYLHLL